MMDTFLYEQFSKNIYLVWLEPFNGNDHMAIWRVHHQVH